MENNEMQLNTKVYFWTRGAGDETPTLRSGRVVACAKESTIYKWYFTIESNGNEYYRRARNCYKSVADAQEAVTGYVIEGAGNE